MTLDLKAIEKRHEMDAPWFMDAGIDPKGYAMTAHEDRAFLLAEVRKLREALSLIAGIENQEFGGDWDEIEEARTIATRALTESKDNGGEK